MAGWIDVHAQFNGGEPQRLKGGSEEGENVRWCEEMEKFRGVFIRGDCNIGRGVKWAGLAQQRRLAGINSTMTKLAVDEQDFGRNLPSLFFVCPKKKRAAGC
ncbi:hypothetical protein MTR_3g026030 [Medicago truncatula]|uniref:Uncharacterized protein n=1 Tax=Medicago truncatula TaxID=3880 RepID=G7IZC2_MEDTR|nr:hypothetical protein MTR_3g026030 [Medicago truncatula]